MNFPLAFAIGFSVASIPGPTILLVASETLRKGAAAGLSVMMAPVLLDALIMLPLGLFFQTALPAGGGRSGLLFVGGALLIWFGLQSITTGNRGFTAPPASSGQLRKGETRPFFKGVLVHLTSPYPYLYWGTVGAPLVRQGFETGGFWAATIFPTGFWLGAVSFTALVIFFLARGKRLLSARWELLLHRALGALLIATGIFLIINGWHGSSGKSSLTQRHGSIPITPCAA